MDHLFLARVHLENIQNPIPEYSGSGTKPPPRVLWLRSKTPFQSTLAQAKNSLQEYSGSQVYPVLADLNEILLLAKRYCSWLRDIALG